MGSCRRLCAGRPFANGGARGGFRTAPDAVKVIEMPFDAGLASLRRIKSAGYSDLQLELL